MRPSLTALLVVLASCAATEDRVPPLDASSQVGAAAPRLEGVTIHALSEPFERALPDGSLRLFDRLLHIEGDGFYGTSRGPIVSFDGEEAWGVEVRSPELIVVYLSSSEPTGARAVRVVNPDGRRAELRVEF